MSAPSVPFPKVFWEKKKLWKDGKSKIYALAVGRTLTITLDSREVVAIFVLI